MSAMIGAISIVIADLIGRTLFLPKKCQQVYLLLRLAPHSSYTYY